MTEWKKVTTPQPGDLADHRSRELDPREVARVDGDMIWLYLMGPNEHGPFPAENYTFKRRVS
jgi:hypothetical protein